MAQKNLFQLVERDTDLYVIDDDGIEQNKPHLDKYLKLSERYTLWIDARPRYLEDILDSVMAGATTIVLRENILQTVSIQKIREDLDKCDIYVVLEQETAVPSSSTILQEADGFILFQTGDIFQDTYPSSLFSTGTEKKRPVYVYDPKEQRQQLWQEHGAQGMLINITDYEKVKNHGV